MKCSHLADSVQEIANPQRRGRQFLATFIAGLTGTRAAGFVLTRQEGAGRWNAATYALKRAAPDDRIGHRTHRTHKLDDLDGSKAVANELPPGGTPITPMTPMSPMPYATADDTVPAW
jgi:hypothetical protein